MNIEASIVIATYNGAHKIERLLNALLKSSCHYEVVVVIDGSSDNTIEIIKTYLSQFSSLRIIHQNNQGRAAARNRGAIESIGETLIFFDDDMEPDIHSIEKHLNFHKLSTSDCLLCGNITELISPDNTDVQNYKAQLNRKWISAFPEGVSRLNFDNLFFTSANCSMRKNLFIQLKMFDNRLRDAEDHDLAYRAIEAGIPVFFDEENIAIHHEVITCRSYILRLRSYRIAHQKLKELYPRRKDFRLGISSGFHRRLIYRLLAQPFFVKWIDQGKMKFLPQTFRYKIYDVVIHSFANIFPSTPI